MKDFILGLIIGLVMGLWTGVNLGQGQDVFSNPFNFLIKHKQPATAQMDKTALPEVKTMNAEPNREKTVSPGSSGSTTPELDNQQTEEGVFKSFMGKFD